MAGVIYTVGHSYARAQGDEKLVQLRERLGHSTLHPGDGTVESILGGIEFVHGADVGRRRVPGAVIAPPPGAAVRRFTLRRKLKITPARFRPGIDAGCC
jgi:hypothetical protein